MAKSFKAAPKAMPPSEAAIDAFVQSGTGKDTRKNSNTEPQIAVKEEKQKRLTVDMPEALHTRYKIACTRNGLKMNDDIRQFIERRCTELGE